MSSWVSSYVSIQAFPAVLAGRWWVLLGLLILTLLGGRLYCRFLCPLGILQSVVRLFRGPRRVCTRLPPTRTQQLVRGVGLILFLTLGLMGLGWQWLEPYAIAFRPFFIWSYPEVEVERVLLVMAPLFAVLLVAFLTRGRGWCNWVCPLGTVFAWLSRFAWRQDRVRACAGCQRCRRCFPAAKEEMAKVKGDETKKERAV